MFGAVPFVFAVCAILVVVSFSGVSCGAIGDLTGDFYWVFFPLRVTWVHLTSLLGWSPVSGYGLITTVVASAAVIVYVVIVVVVVVESLGCFLKAGSCKMTQLFARPAQRSPILNNHHHCHVFESNRVCDGMERSPV